VLQARGSSGSDSVRRARVDSIDRERLAAFNREYKARSAPMAQAGNYLGMLLLLEELEAAAGPSPNVRSMSSQMVGTYDSFLGQDQAALASFAHAFFPNGPVKRPPVDSAPFTGYEAEDAVDAVAKLAVGRQAVFINEAHHVPRHRALTLALLPRLRALGFTYLAAETLDEKDSTLNTRKYPVRASGFYSNEPTFGELLRTALELGFKVVPYEFEASNQDGRETGQARNLVERILRSDPRARVVVHAGYSHIEESGTLFGAKPMAIRFREMTGIDPLTIDQTAMMQQSDTLFDDPRYRHIVHRFEPRTSVILHKGDTVWSAKPGVHDVTVIQPRVTYRDGRPDWLWAMQGGRRPYALPDSVCRAAAQCVVTARLANEAEDAVPIDALRIGPSATSRTLALPAGQFVVAARDAAGALLSERRVTIER
jgi:hypothetical protein